MRKLIVASLLAISCTANAKVVVAVIDTGLDPALMSKPWVCKTGHKDFTGKGLQDNHGHGTHIAGLIEQYAKGTVLDNNATPMQLNEAKADFCILVLKYYDPNASNANNMAGTIKAFQAAIDAKVDIINYSGGGKDPSDTEKAVIQLALSKGIKVVAAAGNDSSDLSSGGTYYPAMYDDRIVAVGNLTQPDSIVEVEFKVKTIVNKERVLVRHMAMTSNYGAPAKYWELGTERLSRIPGGFGTMTGTSQACAVKSGKIVREMLSTK